MYEYEHKSIKKYGARVCINIDKTLYRNGIFTNITTFIYRNIFLHFNINSNLGKTQGQLEAKQYVGRCVGVEKNIKHQLHQKKTSNKDKYKINADYVHGLWKKLKSAKNLTNHNTVEVSAHAPVRGIWTSNYL